MHNHNTCIAEEAECDNVVQLDGEKVDIAKAKYIASNFLAVQFARFSSLFDDGLLEKTVEMNNILHNNVLELSCENKAILETSLGKQTLDWMYGRALTVNDLVGRENVTELIMVENSMVVVKSENLYPILIGNLDHNILQMAECIMFTQIKFILQHLSIEWTEHATSILRINPSKNSTCNIIDGGNITRNTCDSKEKKKIRKKKATANQDAECNVDDWTK